GAGRHGPDKGPQGRAGTVAAASPGVTGVPKKPQVAVPAPPSTRASPVPATNPSAARLAANRTAPASQPATAPAATMPTAAAVDRARRATALVRSTKSDFVASAVCVDPVGLFVMPGRV